MAFENVFWSIDPNGADVQWMKAHNSFVKTVSFLIEDFYTMLHSDKRNNMKSI